MGPWQLVVACTPQLGKQNLYTCPLGPGPEEGGMDMCYSVSLNSMSKLLPTPSRFMPDLTEASTILTELHIQSLAASVPARFRQCHWTLVSGQGCATPFAVCVCVRESPRPSGRRFRPPHRPLTSADSLRDAQWLAAVSGICPCRGRLHTAWGP